MSHARTTAGARFGICAARAPKLPYRPRYVSPGTTNAAGTGPRDFWISGGIGNRLRMETYAAAGKEVFHVGDVIPIHQARARHATEPEVTLTDQPTDIHTATLPMRLVDDDGQLRLYPAVVHDIPVDDKATRDKSGRAFGRTFTAEPIAVSDELAMFMLTSVYGPDTAAAMLYRASRGEYVFGAQNVSQGAGHRWKCGVNVAADLSRDAGYVLQFSGLRQRSSK